MAAGGALTPPNPARQLDQQVGATLGGDLVDGVADEGVLRSHAQPSITFIRSTAEGRALGSLVRQRETKWTKSEDQWEECSVGGSAMTMLFTSYA